MQRSNVGGRTAQQPIAARAIIGDSHMNIFFLLVFVLAAGIAAAQAQNYPSRPITIISGVPPGSGTDTFARVFGERMKSSLGQPLIVENITGAGGTIGTTRAARAAPDGYTLSAGNIGTHVVSPA